MQELDDNALLRQYAEQNSEKAFATLVERHVDKVYSVALRHTRNVHAAEEITQAVFVILAKKAGRLGGKVVVPGWLYETARLTALTYVRSEIRRARREQEAHMQTVLNEDDAEVWPHIAPLLDDALAGLSAADRHAIVLRYFDGKSLGEVGAALGASEDAAKKRVGRAVERLRGFFTKRGATLTTTVLAAAISANAVQAAPLSLAATVAATTVKGAVVSGSTLTLIKGALKVMAWTKMKTAAVVASALVFTAGTAVIVVEKNTSGYPSWSEKPQYWELSSDALNSVPPVFVLRPTKFPKDTGAVFAGNKVVMKNRSLRWLLATAYNFDEARIILPDDLPEQHFDLLLTLPDRPLEQLQERLKDEFGITAHREVRQTKVMMSKLVRPGSPGLRASSEGSHSSQTTGPFEIDLRNCDFAYFLGKLEARLGVPVLNQTGLGGRYDIRMKWSSQAGESELDSLRRALRDQLGLELVSFNTPIEMLVVEKAK